MMSRLGNLSSISAMINDSEYCLCPQFFGKKNKIKWRAYIIKYIHFLYIKTESFYTSSFIFFIKHFDSTKAIYHSSNVELIKIFVVFSAYYFESLFFFLAL